MKPYFQTLRFLASLSLLNFLIIGCEKEQTGPSHVISLLTSGPWYLRYTDSTTDNANDPVRFYHLPASDCAQMTPITFSDIINYSVRPQCNGAAGTISTGQWSIDSDTLLFYGLTGEDLLPAYIRDISKDSMTLYEYHAYDTSVYRRPIFVTDVYSH